MRTLIRRIKTLARNLRGLRLLDRMSSRLDVLETRTREDRRAVYLASAQLAAAHPTSLSPYAQAELQVFSQNGEDGVIAAILTDIGVTTPSFVEFGIEDGSTGNCVFLADVLGWSGLFIEADPGQGARLAAKYANRTDVRTLTAHVTPENIDELLTANGVPPEPAVMSIDIDGNDYWVWDAISSVRPSVVVIEYNSALPADLAIVQPVDSPPWDGLSPVWGASSGALERLADQKGYSLVYLEMTGVNAFFVRNDLLASLPTRAVLRSPNYRLSNRVPQIQPAHFIAVGASEKPPQRNAP
jgi:hypothetical protein